MGCTSCGGGRSAGGVRKGVKPNARGIASRAKKLQWAHVSVRGAVARYATQKEAEAAVKLFGGTAEKRND